MPQQPRRSKRRHNVLYFLRSGVLGSPPFFCSDATHAESFPSCGSWVAFSLGCQPGSYESAPLVAWSVLGSPPLCTVRHCTGQVATDPQSPEGGSQRACPTRGAHPTASGRHALAVNKRSLWDASPGDLSQPPCSKIGFWVVALYSLSQRGLQHLFREQGQCPIAQAGTLLIACLPSPVSQPSRSRSQRVW